MDLDRWKDLAHRLLEQMQRWTVAAGFGSDRVVKGLGRGRSRDGSCDFRFRSKEGLIGISYLGQVTQLESKHGVRAKEGRKALAMGKKISCGS